MLKANELRIGNFIKFHNHLETEKVITVNARFFSSLAGGRSLEEMKSDEELSNYYSGIPLTLEILEKCGWGKSDEHEIGTNMLNENNDGLYFDYHFKRFRMDFGDNSDIRMPHIQYLHQLQNLYYSLTGDELEIVW